MLYFSESAGLRIPHLLSKVRDMLRNEALMTIDELSGYLKVTRRTVYEWLKNRKIPAVKLVGQWRFKKDKIDDWLERQSK